MWQEIVIGKAKLKDNKDDILKFRNYVIDINDELLNPLKIWADFYSISELRDLTFHCNEHQFNLLKIKDMISKLKMEFIGFEFLDQKNFNNFTNIYGVNKLYSLDVWNKHEENNHNLFNGMYQFWLEKK